MKIRSNLTVMCGYRASGRSEYIEDMKKKGIPFKVVSFDETAMKEYDTLVLTPEEAAAVYVLCVNKIKELIAEGNNIYYDACNYTKRSRKDMISDIRQFCRANAVRCWLSTMYFPADKDNCIMKMDTSQRDATTEENMEVEIPEKIEGWNDILLYSPKGFKQIKCHTNLIV